MDLATTHLTADLDGVASMVALVLLEGPIEAALPGAMDPTSSAFWRDHAADLPPLIPVRDLPRRLASEPLGRLRVGDTSSPARLGLIGEYAPRFQDVRCYDTHPPQDDDLPRAATAQAGAAVSGLVLALAEAGHQPERAHASLFLLGVHVDTGHLTFPTTTALDHQAAALCLGWGADLTLLGRYAPRGYTSHQLALLEEMARNTRFEPMGNLDVPVLRLELDDYEPDLSVLLEQLREAEGWPVCFLLAAQGGRVAIIGRGDGGLNVGDALRPLGGGGHAEAASTILHGVSLLDAGMMLQGSLKDLLGRRRSALRVAARRFVALPADASIADAADTLHHNRINALPLTEPGPGGPAFVGLVSRQEVDAAMRHRLGPRPVREINSGPPAWVSADASITEARRALLNDGRRLLMVGDPARPPEGILTRSLLFRSWEAEDLARPSEGETMPPGQVTALLRRGLWSAWPRLVALGELATELDLPVHLVGGPVRDALLHRKVKDIDLVVEGDARRLARAAAARLGGRVHVHDEFGTARWQPEDGPDIDLASARVEFYPEPAALPRVLHAELRRDLYRRDFSVNAMAIALNPEERGALLDPFGGLRDLRQGLLRVLHGLSFHDDPSRAWRAARLAARFDFRLAPQTQGLLAAARRAGVLDALGLERLGGEIDRILRESEVVHAFRLLRDWELLGQIHPRFSSAPPFLEQLASVAAAVQRMAGLRRVEPTPGLQAEALWLVLASAVPAADREARIRLVPGGRHAQRRWLSGPERVAQALGRLRGGPRNALVARALVGLDPVERSYALGLAEHPRIETAIVWWEEQGLQVRSAVTGDTLLAAGVPPGPKLGHALRAAQDAAWDGASEADQHAAARATLAREEGGAP